MGTGVYFFCGGMGKREKQKVKEKHGRSQRGRDYYLQDEDHIHDTSAPHSSSSPRSDDDDDEDKQHDGDAYNSGVEETEDGEAKNHQHPSHDMPSKFLLYQQSVQVCAKKLMGCCVFLL